MASLSKDTGHKIQMKLLLAALDNERTGQRINDMDWDVIDLPASAFPLLTSDWPAELAFAKGIISIPIGPRKLFVAANTSGKLKQIKEASSRSLARAMNLFVVQGARRYVYAHEDTQTHFIRKHISSNKMVPPLWPSLGQTHTQQLTTLKARVSKPDAN